MKAIWNNCIVAESDDIVIVEGNNYFPVEALNKSYLKPSTRQTQCFWKGTASYYHLKVDGQLNKNAVWYYPAPSQRAQEITGRVAFWKGVQFED